MESITGYKTPSDEEILSSLEYRISVHEANVKEVQGKPSITLRTHAYAHLHKAPVEFIVANETWKNLNFNNRNLSRSKFSNSKISCDFDDCDMSHSEFFKCTFGNNTYVTKLYYSSLLVSDFENCTFSNMRFINVDLSNSLFKNCKFVRCNFEKCNLLSATFENCTFEHSRLTCVDMTNCNIADSTFNDVAFSAVNFASANIFDCSIDNVKTDNYTSHWHIACPQEGAFIAWKRAAGDKFVKLQICEDARRSSSTSRKCRCDKALVLGIYDENKTLLSDVTSARSIHNKNFVYEVNKIVHVNNFDDNHWMECAPGIHFFLTFEEAKNYHA